MHECMYVCMYVCKHGGPTQHCIKLATRLYLLIYTFIYLFIYLCKDHSLPSDPTNTFYFPPPPLFFPSMTLYPIFSFFSSLVSSFLSLASLSSLFFLSSIFHFTFSFPFLHHLINSFYSSKNTFFLFSQVFLPSFHLPHMSFFSSPCPHHYHFIPVSSFFPPLPPPSPPPSASDI